MEYQENTFDDLCSEAQFDTLAFSDVTSLNQEEKQAAAESMDIALAAILKKIGFRYYIAEHDTNLRSELYTWSRHNLQSVYKSNNMFFNTTVDTGAACVEYFYPLAHHDTRLQMGKALIATISMDDISGVLASREQLAHFQYDFWQKKQYQDGFLKVYMEVIGGFVEHFGAKDHRLGTMGGNDLANFAEACSIEDCFAAKLPPHLAYTPPGMRTNGCCPENFAFYFRSMTGIPRSIMLGIFKPSREIEVPLEFWITSMTNLMTCINLTNDLLSYRKELLDGETFNYMSLQTQAKRQANMPSQFLTTHSADEWWTVRDTICEAMNEVYKAKHALDLAFVQFAEYDSYIARTPMLTICQDMYGTRAIGMECRACKSGLDRIFKRIYLVAHKLPKV